MSEWQDISTAPKDGTKVLLFTRYFGRHDLGGSFTAVQIGYWDEGKLDVPQDHPFWRPAEWHLQLIGNPTHWQPLPKPPSEPLGSSTLPAEANSRPL